MNNANIVHYLDNNQGFRYWFMWVLTTHAPLDEVIKQPH